MQELSQRPTPLLRWRGALLKLESLRPGGGADDRALGIFPQLGRGSQASLAATGPAALAAAGWARRRGVQLAVAVHGALSHEMREALRMWGARFEELPSRQDALRRAADLPGTKLPPLDGPKAAAELARTFGAEVLADLVGPPGAIVAPAGAMAALLGTSQAVRSRWPQVRAVALTAADVELPELSFAAQVPGFEVRPVTFAEASRARTELARTSGVLASHAAAAAAAVAEELGGLALITSGGEREFSLERAP
ncbi:MAG TPA: pyridoxal-phosphate dependent enzyme [Myxococcales bacterium]|nr:pyridoxal-phosphate dependent enzyme [Myxococcales bacterium]